MTRTLLLVGLAILPIAGGQATEQPPPDSGLPSCSVTKMVRAKPVLDPPSVVPDAEHDPFPIGPWYVNAERTLWAGMGHINHLTTRGNKVMWIRPQGTQLEIIGRRLDADAPPMEARIPCCYPGGYQSTGLMFPTEGCWDVSAKSGVHQLTFVTRVWSAPPDEK